MTCLNASNTISLIRWHRAAMLENPSGEVIGLHLRNRDRARVWVDRVARLARQGVAPDPIRITRLKEALP